jgi:hypothetical protein
VLVSLIGYWQGHESPTRTVTTFLSSQHLVQKMSSSSLVLPASKASVGGGEGAVYVSSCQTSTCQPHLGRRPPCRGVWTGARSAQEEARTGVQESRDCCTVCCTLPLCCTEVQTGLTFWYQNWYQIWQPVGPLLLGGAQAAACCSFNADSPTSIKQRKQNHADQAESASWQQNVWLGCCHWHMQA